MEVFSETTNGIRVVKQGADVIVLLPEDTNKLEMRDYIELLFSVANGDIAIYDGTQELFWNTPKLQEIVEEWEWREFLTSIDGRDISEVWAEAEWFQSLFGFATGISDYYSDIDSDTPVDIEKFIKVAEDISYLEL